MDEGDDRRKRRPGKPAIWLRPSRLRLSLREVPAASRARRDPMPADQPPTTTLLRDLVSLPSVNPMGRRVQGPEYFEGRVTDYLERFFRGLGVPVERQTAAPGRDNILARFKSPGATNTVPPEAHHDTVPVDA